MVPICLKQTTPTVLLIQQNRPAKSGADFFGEGPAAAAEREGGSEFKKNNVINVFKSDFEPHPIPMTCYTSSDNFLGAGGICEMIFGMMFGMPNSILSLPKILQRRCVGILYNGFLRRSLGIQTHTHKVFGRLYLEVQDTKVTGYM